MNAPLRGLVALVALAVPGVCRAQQVLALTADPAVGPPSGQVTLTVRDGETGGVIAPDSLAVRWMFYRWQDRVRNWSVPPVQDRVLAVQAPEVGCGQIGIDLLPNVQTLRRDSLQRFLQRRGNGQVPAGESGDLRVRRVESMTTLVRVRDGLTERTPSPIATRKSGQRVEIRPLDDPTVAVPGSDIFFRGYVDGTSARGLDLFVVGPDGQGLRIRTDDKGIAHVRIDRAGAWRVELHVLEPDPAGETDGTLWSAVLAFEVPEA